ncbi:MAG: PorT family protein [Candidatus Zixiibacteriota bacterium]|nr:MAG: PorT family protein [candidate division Zixibacteria bacterium]
MKRTLFVLLAVALAATFLFPGAVFGRRLTEIGLKAGLNIADYRGDLPYTDSKMGFCGGPFITCSINEMLAVQTEFLFSMKGAKLGERVRADEYGNIIETSSIRDVINYLEIPVLGKLSVLPQGRVRPNLFAGPFFALKLTGKHKLGSQETDLENLKDTDYGLVFGGGVDFELGQGELTADARYNLGLAKIFDSPMDVRNRVISVMLGYSF